MINPVKPILTFWQKFIKYLSLWAIVMLTVFLCTLYYKAFREKEVEYVETIVEKYMSTPIYKGLDELKQGELVKWGEFLMCVSSIDMSNIKLSSDEGDAPPVIINLRLNGLCK